MSLNDSLSPAAGRRKSFSLTSCLGWILQNRASSSGFLQHGTKGATLNTWRGLAFERLCLWHVPQIKAALGISGVLTEVYAWRHVPDDVRPWGVQIDLLLDRADRVVNVCEMKYVSDEYVIDAEAEKSLIRKCETFSAVTKTKCAVHLTLVTTKGVFKNTHSGIVQSEVTLNDLFRP